MFYYCRMFKEYKHPYMELKLALKVDLEQIDK